MRSRQEFLKFQPQDDNLGHDRITSLYGGYASLLVKTIHRSRDRSVENKERTVEKLNIVVERLRKQAIKPLKMIFL